MATTTITNPELQGELQRAGVRVRVARNLHKDLLSIRVKGKVVGYTSATKLADVEFKVLESGRQRCLRERKKNLHAFAEGRIAHGEVPPFGHSATAISYNPYRMGSFYSKETGEPVAGADYLYIFADGTMVAINPKSGEEN